MGGKRDLKGRKRKTGMRKGTHACIECRLRKSKCDRVEGQTTPCSSCKLRKIESKCLLQWPATSGDISRKPESDPKSVQDLEDDLVPSLPPRQEVDVLGQHVCPFQGSDSDDLSQLLTDVVFVESQSLKCLHHIIYALSEQQGKLRSSGDSTMEHFRAACELLKVVPKSIETVVLELLMLTFTLRQGLFEDCWTFLHMCISDALALGIYQARNRVQHRCWLILIHYDRLVSALMRRPYDVREDYCDSRHLEIESMIKTLGVFMGLRCRLSLLMGHVADSVRMGKDLAPMHRALADWKFALTNSTGLTELQFKRLMLDYFMAKTFLEQTDRNAVACIVIETSPLYESLWASHPEAFVKHPDITLCGCVLLLCHTVHLVMAQQEYRETEAIRNELAIDHELLFNKGPVRQLLMRFKKLFGRLCMVNAIGQHAQEYFDAAKVISGLVKLKRRCPNLSEDIEERMENRMRYKCVDLRAPVFGVDLGPVVDLLHAPVKALKFNTEPWKDVIEDSWLESAQSGFTL